MHSVLHRPARVPTALRLRLRSFERFLLTPEYLEYRQTVQRTLGFTLHELGNAVSPLMLSSTLFPSPAQETLEGLEKHLTALFKCLQASEELLSSAKTRFGFFFQLKRLRQSIVRLHDTVRAMKTTLQEAHSVSGACNDEDYYSIVLRTVDLSKLLLSSLEAELDEQPKELLLTDISLSHLFTKIQKLYDMGDVTFSSGSDPVLRIDVLRVAQVLYNLRKNAREAGATGISIRMEPVSDRYAHLLVEDNGPGIPDAMISTIFENGVSTKSSATNRGAGLAICRHIVEEHGGQISAYNMPGGAVFRIRLPLAQSVPAAAAASG